MERLRNGEFCEQSVCREVCAAGIFTCAQSHSQESILRRRCYETRMSEGQIK